MNSKKSRNIGFNDKNLLLIVGGIITFIFLGYVFYLTYQSQKSLISIMIIPLITGVIFENKRLSSDWKTIALKIFGAIALSVFAFIPGKTAIHYDLETHIKIWPYWFVFFFVFISMIYHQKKITPKLTEGITLLQSISIIYWIIDIGLYNFKNVFSFFIIGVGLIFCLISFLHSFSYIKLTKNSRLFLSIWSSIIMIIFAVDHIYRVFNFNHFHDNNTLNDWLNALQHFLLGVSLIYILQNANMLFVYLPDKHSFYGKVQMNDIRNMNMTHIERYSTNQIKISDSILALIFTSGIYYWNYQYHIMPRHTLIWVIIWIFPLVIWVKEILTKENI